MRTGLCGDFEAIVEFELVGFPVPGSGSCWAGIGAADCGIERYNRFVAGDCAPAATSYKSCVGTSLNCSASCGLVATTDAAGCYRITRTGTNLALFYDNAGWQQLASGSLAGEVFVSLFIGSDDHAGPLHVVGVGTQLNVPSPFVPPSTIRFALSRNATARLDLYDVAGPASMLSSTNIWVPVRTSLHGRARMTQAAHCHPDFICCDWRRETKARRDAFFY